MRFISMHKVDAAMEAGVPPTPELMAGMGALIQDMVEAGVFVAGEGLGPSSTRVRLRFSGGRRTVTPGPFAGSNELVARLALIQVRSQEDAIEWSSRYAEAAGAEELDVGPVNEPWDIGACPPPAETPPRRFLLLHKADARSESGAALDASRRAALTKVLADMRKAGVLLLFEELLPSAKGARLVAARGKTTVTDGPFTESKELIAGFGLLQVRSKAEALTWGARFAAVIGDVELDVLQVSEGG